MANIWGDYDRLVPPPKLALLMHFDSAVFVGDLPILAFARHCAEQLSDTAATTLIDGTRFFLEGTAFDGRPINLPGTLTGEQTVRALATTADLSASQIDQAYQLSRADLARSAFVLDPVPGLLELLLEFPDFHVVLICGSDVTGVAEVLDAVGLAAHVHEWATVADSPGYLAPLIETTLRQLGGNALPEHVMVLKDHHIVRAWALRQLDSGTHQQHHPASQ